MTDLSRDYHTIEALLQGSNISFKSSIPDFCSFGSSLMKGAMNGKHKCLAGADIEAQSLIWQWIEHRVAAVLSSNLVVLANNLNQHLESCVYVVDDCFTLADIVLFFAMQSFITGLSVYEKQSKYMNVSRWFSFIQQHKLIMSAPSTKMCVNINNKIYS